jgi:four helix bundle protein
MPNSGGKQYDLEERTLRFAKNVRLFIKHLPRSVTNFEDGKQLARSSGSVGANYIEANESLTKKDFRLRIKICRKEAKESRYWLQLIDLTGQENLEVDRKALIRESQELMNIFGAILRRSEELNS